MEEYLPIWIVIVMALIFGIVGFGGYYNNNENYENAITLSNNDDYDIYLDGEKKDNSTFKISSLDKNKYTFKIDNENKEISINTNRRNNRGTNFIPLPMFLH